MSDYLLTQAISQFAELVLDLSDSDLEQEWVWGSYESEGVRFAYFRTYEQLRELAVKIRVARDAAGKPLTEVQLILAQYHAAYLDLQAVMRDVDSELAEMPPAEGEWPLRRVYAHIVGADLGFYVTIKYTLDRYRQGLDPLEEIQDETWLDIARMDGKKLDSIMAEPLDGLQTYHRQLHAQILEDFVDINPGELQMPSRFWEKEPLSVSFRLGRFDSHLRQHTVQIEKTLVDLGYHPNESKRLLRLIYAAFAEVEGALLGAPEISRREIELLAKKIAARTEEIRAILD